MAKRWCVVEQDEQHDLFVGDPWHVHLVDLNMRLDGPRERTVCGDLLPARPVFRELVRPVMKALCPHCVEVAQSARKRSPAVALRAPEALSAAQPISSQFELYPVNQKVRS